MTTLSSRGVWEMDGRPIRASLERGRVALMAAAWVGGLAGALLWYWPILVCNVLPGLTCCQWLNELLYLQMDDFWCSRLLWAVGLALSLGASFVGGASSRWPDGVTVSLIFNGTHLGLILLGPSV